MKFLLIHPFILMLGSAFVCLPVSCTKGTGIVSPPVPPPSLVNLEVPTSNGIWWRPQPGLSFDWVLTNPEASGAYSTEVVDLDAFDTSPETIQALHAKGEKVVAYLSVGTLEDSRPDGNLLPSETLGNVYKEYPDERWLDIRQVAKLKPWLITRLRMIAGKQFDAVEPDNLDGYQNSSGFPLTDQDTRNFCDSIIFLAHAFGLSIGQKNVPDLSPEFSKKFDWALTEDAYKQGFVGQMAPYIAQNKPVFVVEYTDLTTQTDFESNVCPDAKIKGFSALLKNRDLDPIRLACP